MDANQDEPGGLLQTGKRKNVWLHADEAEALAKAAKRERRSEGAVIRDALRQYLGIED